MMITFAAAQLLLLVPMSWFVGRSNSARTARHRASYVMALAGIIALVQVAWHTFELPGLGWSADWLSIEDPHSWVPAFSLFTCLMGFTAIALSPISETRPRTYRRILLLISVALTFLAIRHPIGLAVLWGASALVTWLELKDLKQPPRIAKLFAIYQLPSVIAFALGAILLVQGRTTPGLALLLVGIGVREAVIPLHSWFPSFVEHAPMGLVVAFFAPQLGVYAHLELLRGDLPYELAHGVASLGAITAVVAAALGLAQTDARRALAFLIMSQTGLVAFGLDTSSPVAQIGALLTWQVIGVATAGFAMTLASLEARRGNLSLRSPAGSFTRTPRMAVAFLFMGFASVGLPLTLGFIAEDLLVQGSVQEFPVLAFALILATALNGVSVMRAFFLLFSGSAEHIGERDLTRREAGTLTVVMAMLLGTGLFPARTVRGLERVTEEGRTSVTGTTLMPVAPEHPVPSVHCPLIQSPTNIMSAHGPSGRHRLTPYFDLSRAADGKESASVVHGKWVLGSPIDFDGKRYEFEQAHFHRPSAHMIDGMGYPLEMHVVNVAARGASNSSPERLVIGILFREGKEDPFIDGLLDHMTDMGRNGIELDDQPLENLLASDEGRDYYHYRGLVATPPYIEHVHSIVLKEPRTASPEQIDKLRVSGTETTPPAQTLRGVESG